MQMLHLRGNVTAGAAKYDIEYILLRWCGGQRDRYRRGRAWNRFPSELNGTERCQRLTTAAKFLLRNAHALYVAEMPP